MNARHGRDAMITRKYFIVATIFITGLTSGLLSFIAVSSAEQIGNSASQPPAKDAAEMVSSVKGLADRDVYYPGTEDLAPDEMRIIACGTGHPMARPKQPA